MTVHQVADCAFRTARTIIHARTRNVVSYACFLFQGLGAARHSLLELPHSAAPLGDCASGSSRPRDQPAQDGLQLGRSVSHGDHSGRGARSDALHDGFSDYCSEASALVGQHHLGVGLSSGILVPARLEEQRQRRTRCPPEPPGGFFALGLHERPTLG